LFTPGLTLPPLPYSDNSLVVHFAAVSSPFDPPFPLKFCSMAPPSNGCRRATWAPHRSTAEEGSYVSMCGRSSPGTGRGGLAGLHRAGAVVRTRLAWVIYISPRSAWCCWSPGYSLSWSGAKPFALERLVAERTARSILPHAARRQVEETMRRPRLAAVRNVIAGSMPNSRAGSTNARRNCRTRTRSKKESRAPADQEERRSCRDSSLRPRRWNRGRWRRCGARLQQHLQPSWAMWLCARRSSAGNIGARESEEIQKSAQRSAELTRQLLGCPKQTIQPKILDLNDTVAACSRCSAD